MHASCTNTLLFVPYTYQAPVPLVIAQDGASNAHVPGPASAPCSVYVLLVGGGHVEIYHVLQARDVYTPPYHLGGDQERASALRKGVQVLR